MSESFIEWIGRSVTRRDMVTARLLAEFRVTLAPHLFEAADDIAPPGFHFGMAPALLAATQLGEDGAESRGHFMPPLPFAHRMWAGGSIESLLPLREGMRVRRRSTVTDITHRTGHSGEFYVVSVLHEIEADGAVAVRERQDIVYRQAIRAAASIEPEPFAADLSWQVTADALWLFRYSAFTFNGHRIHYDLDFARGKEGHAGLLVHGPLQATLLLNQLSALRGRVPQRMRYRCLAALTAPQSFDVLSRRTPDGAAARIVSQDGIVTCEASVG
jgi:3-methylfumaryl-CoA hydratase